MNEQYFINGLNRAIQFIEESPEINIVGIRDALIKNALNTEVLDGMYADVLSYVLDTENKLLLLS